MVFPGKSFFSAHEVSTCKISGCLSYRILDSGPDGTQTTLTDKRHQLESTRRTLESMVADGLLDKVTVYEQRQNTTQGSANSAGVWCNCSRYGLPGQCTVIRDTAGADNSISGEYVRVG
ncbi:hypothetical protein AAHD79_21130 [Citrobacter freundii]|uniref:hypothetical protein n=1 Tax=Citrobacter freundii TaxID=546 RepID=UPI003966D090